MESQLSEVGTPHPEVPYASDGIRWARQEIRLPRIPLLLPPPAGFIQKLPTQLVAAFRATLEEIKDASLLLHCVDVSHPNAAAQIEAVNSVLEELGVQNIPTLTVWNKVGCVFMGLGDWGSERRWACRACPRSTSRTGCG